MRPTDKSPKPPRAHWPPPFHPVSPIQQKPDLIASRLTPRPPLQNAKSTSIQRLKSGFAVERRPPPAVYHPVVLGDQIQRAQMLASAGRPQAGMRISPCIQAMRGGGYYSPLDNEYQAQARAELGGIPAHGSGHTGDAENRNTQDRRREEIERAHQLEEEADKRRRQEEASARAEAKQEKQQIRADRERQKQAGELKLMAHALWAKRAQFSLNRYDASILQEYCEKVSLSTKAQKERDKISIQDLNDNLLDIIAFVKQQI
jgi:hypothetical protein